MPAHGAHKAHIMEIIIASSTEIATIFDTFRTIFVIFFGSSAGYAPVFLVRKTLFFYQRTLFVYIVHCLSTVPGGIGHFRR